MRVRLPRPAERTGRPGPVRRGHAPARPARTEEHRLPLPAPEEIADPGDDPGPPFAAPAAGAIDTPERRARASGGPQDHALYSCGCGYVFDASVSTSVHCPHCGDTQAW
jgi:hypothetical protein